MIDSETERRRGLGRQTRKAAHCNVLATMEGSREKGGGGMLFTEREDTFKSHDSRNKPLPTHALLSPPPPHHRICTYSQGRGESSPLGSPTTHVFCGCPLPPVSSEPMSPNPAPDSALVFFSAAIMIHCEGEEARQHNPTSTGILFGALKSELYPHMAIQPHACADAQRERDRRRRKKGPLCHPSASKKQ
jgi:hypothetical protein